MHNRKIKELKETDTDIISFAALIQRSLNHSSPGSLSAEPLAELDYDYEVEIKNSALQNYWKQAGIPGVPELIIPSPRGRKYRTTTKRRIVFGGGKYLLLLGPKSEIQTESLYYKSVLEPDEHSEIYKYLSTCINEPSFTLLGKNLNYIIIRGNYNEFSIIFNMHTLNAEIVRKLKLMGTRLQKLNTKIISAFIYLDPTRSEYYLESERPPDLLNFKKLYGPDKIFLKVDSSKFSYHPTSFSQVNESIIPHFVAEAGKMLMAEGKKYLYDLYCGYGLLTLSLAQEYYGCTGIDIGEESIKSAVVNAEFQKAANKIKFLAKNITGQYLTQIFPGKRYIEHFLLDPPRQGTGHSVIKAVAERDPEKVLHIFCGIGEIKREILEWAKHDYYIKSIRPLDMFPGTPNLETMILLQKNR